MGAASAVLMLVSLISLQPPPTPGPVAGLSGGQPVSIDDLRRHGAVRGDQPSVARAILAARSELALAIEARSMLGAAVANVPRAEAAQALIHHLFHPRVCAKIPAPAKREHYAATRWRFLAPPAWHVEDLQLLCCEDARDCKRPEAAQCVTERTAEVAQLFERIRPRPVEEGVLEAEMQWTREAGRQAARSEYIFYHDPNESGPVDGRLQTVDAPIAQAVSSSGPQEWIGPVSTRFGHHILRLKRRRPPIQLSYESPQAQAILTTELCPAFLLDQRSRYVHELLRVQAWRPDPAQLEATFGAQETGAP